MDVIELSKTIAQLGGLVVFATLLVLGFVLPRGSVDAILKERDKADVIRDARLEDQKAINRDLIVVAKDSAEALKRLADAWEARNSAEANRRRSTDV